MAVQKTKTYHLRKIIKTFVANLCEGFLLYRNMICRHSFIKIECFDKLTQSIFPKAFRGELIPQDPNDEPASVLLAKICNAPH